MTSPRIRVKICGITRPSDAEALDALPIDYLGFNFSPRSKRFVEPRTAAEMISRLQHAEPVGVFVDASPKHILEVAGATGIRWIQLHGNEDWDVLEKIALPVIKAIPHTRLSDYGGLKMEWGNRQGQPRYFLVDTLAAAQGGDAFGGSGHAFDWSLLESKPLPLPYFLAGGLGPENLARALTSVKPFAVDLNSRVESAPGIKDLDLVKQCLEIVKAL
jgi:phosphoribosylanthranilate isomerase